MVAARSGLGLVLVGLLAAAACASRSQSSREPDFTYAIEVQNNLAEPEPIDVYLVTAGGRARLIGRVQANSRRTFEFEEIAGGSYQLVARGQTNDRELRSRTFSLIGTRRLEWNMFGNLVSVLERR